MSDDKIDPNNQMVFYTGDGTQMVCLHKSHEPRVISLGWRRATEQEINAYSERLLKINKENKKLAESILQKIIL